MSYLDTLPPRWWWPPKLLKVAAASMLLQWLWMQLALWAGMPMWECVLVGLVWAMRNGSECSAAHWRWWRGQ